MIGRADRERGNVILFAVVLAGTLMMITGLVVDGGGQIQAYQRADVIAREAARQGGQSMTSDSVRGEGSRVDPVAGRAAAQRYLAAAAVTGTVTISGAGLHVTVTTTYEPKFLSAIGIRRLSATGEADSQSDNVLEGRR